MSGRSTQGAPVGRTVPPAAATAVPQQVVWFLALWVFVFLLAFRPRVAVRASRVAVVLAILLLTRRERPSAPPRPAVYIP